MKIGIFFGGQSREREISFAGGRTVYDNLNKSLFEAVPVFVDSLGNFILLDWQYIYKGTIRDFYPPVDTLPAKKHTFQVYIESLGKLSDAELNNIISKVGKKISPEDFQKYFDFAFLALHGPYGEDGNIQGILEWYGIPYTGSGILPSAIGINKLAQKQLMQTLGFKSPLNATLSKKTWVGAKEKQFILDDIIGDLGLPFVVKSPNQGSSIGVSVLSDGNLEKFEAAVNKSFFIQEIKAAEWTKLSADGKYALIRDLTDIRVGIGMPVYVAGELIVHPSDLLDYLDKAFAGGQKSVVIESLDGEELIMFEGFIKGQEFSCIVIQDEDGKAIALPPTEIVKGNDVFDYRSKYLPGMSRKITPINLPDAQIEQIRKECENLYVQLQFNVYARIDGFINGKGEIFLNDPNTTSGMMPSSFFFHQAAEIGLNPSQFLTYIIRTSLAERLKTGKHIFAIRSLLEQLDSHIEKLNSTASEKVKVAVIMGGYSSERHISVESGRNIFEKLASSTKYQPFPVFLTGSDQAHELYHIPVNVMLKDNADDIKEKVHAVNQQRHPIIEKIINETKSITEKFASKAIFKAEKINYDQLGQMVDAVFIALHGRPGEDGSLQVELEKVGLYYNGSGTESSAITINKYETNKLLRQHGISVANHRLVYQQEWEKGEDEIVADIEAGFKYPIIAKPADDGCSSAVKKIKNREELIAFAHMMFRSEPEFLEAESKVLNLKYKEEFPQKTYFLIEDLITRQNAKHFLEVTGGMLTKATDKGIQYEVFEPSETLASGEVLSLEEKFLAGEGQNITPSRFSPNKEEQVFISKQVRAELEKVAKILNIEGYCRIDAFVRIFEDNSAETIIIEINSLPGMTPATVIFHQCAINGYKPYEFIDAILEYGKTKKKKLVA